MIKFLFQADQTLEVPALVTNNVDIKADNVTAVAGNMTKAKVKAVSVFGTKRREKTSIQTG